MKLPSHVPAPSAPTPDLIHRVFLTHRDYIELWGITTEPAVPIASLEEAYTVNDGVDADGVAR